MNGRWVRRPDGANWGDFGADDQLGRLNLIGREQRLAAAREIQSGESFCLSLPLDYPGGNALNPRRHPPMLTPTELAGVPFYNRCLHDYHPALNDVISDDVLTLHTQYSTQWDALSHVGSLFDGAEDGVSRPTYYNGFVGGLDVKAPADRASLGDSALGVDVMARHGIQGRGVLIDLESHFGRSFRRVDYDDWSRALDGITIETGDILCIHTGYADMLLSYERNPPADRLHGIGCGLDGRDERLLRWITDSGIAAIAADNYAVEHIDETPREGDRFKVPLHHHCLFKLGIPLGELWYFSALREWLNRHQRHHFFLTATPLYLPGGAGSPVSPIATV